MTLELVSWEKLSESVFFSHSYNISEYNVSSHDRQAQKNKFCIKSVAGLHPLLSTMFLSA